MFLGSLFPPNQLSIEWFMREVMPRLHNIRLNIVGKGFEKLKGIYEQNTNVHVIGSVRELDEYYYKHAGVVLPIRYGAGMKVKTAEAMMYGRMIFASDEALEGYEVEGIEGIVRCNSAEEYANAINKYYNRSIFKPYRDSVRKLFLEKYETNLLYERMKEFLDILLCK